jgi:predicted nucleotidyltransferase
MLEDWIELCRLFNDKGVEYLLVGGQAVIAHGYPRLTKDLDLWVRPTRDNGLLVLDALTEFGAPVQLTAEQFESPRTLLVLGREPFRVDILTSIRGIDFDRAWPGRDRVTLEGVTIPLIAKADLITNKQAVGRLQDLADIEALQALDRPRD